MKKILKNIGFTVFYFVFCIILFAYESIKYVLSGRNVHRKVFIIAGYIGAIVAAIYKPIFFCTILGLFLFGILSLAIYTTKHSEKKKTHGSGEQEEYQTSEQQKDLFFDGMSLEEAKKEYRNLMKKYHPDNVGGDLEMTQRISAAYSQYCRLYTH